MIDGVPEVRDFVASGRVSVERDSQGRTVYRTTPGVHEEINAALAGRGRAARAATAGRQVTAILCGEDGAQLTDYDREVIEAFADALAIDDEHERRAAVLALDA